MDLVGLWDGIATTAHTVSAFHFRIGLVSDCVWIGYQSAREVRDRDVRVGTLATLGAPALVPLAS